MLLLPPPLAGPDGPIDTAMLAARGGRARIFDSAAIRIMGDWRRA